MRLWSLHPKYLDAKGLVALWREALLAKHVLLGQTKGYMHHPQLTRFRAEPDPVGLVDQYLAEVHREATNRGYRFDAGKINWDYNEAKIPVTRGQVVYETGHLVRKLKVRDKARYKLLRDRKRLQVHPLFVVAPGGIEAWEVI